MDNEKDMRINEEDLSDVSGGKKYVLDVSKLRMTAEQIQRARQEGSTQRRVTTNSDSSFK